MKEYESYLCEVCMCNKCPPEIEGQSNEACPQCGAYWGHPDPDLCRANRPKVDVGHGWEWKCYKCGNFYIPMVFEVGAKITINNPRPPRLHAGLEYCKSCGLYSAECKKMYGQIHERCCNECSALMNGRFNEWTYLYSGARLTRAENYESNTANRDDMSAAENQHTSLFSEEDCCEKTASECAIRLCCEDCCHLTHLAGENPKVLCGVCGRAGKHTREGNTTYIMCKECRRPQQHCLCGKACPVCGEGGYIGHPWWCRADNRKTAMQDAVNLVLHSENPPIKGRSRVVTKKILDTLSWETLVIIQQVYNTKEQYSDYGMRGVPARGGIEIFVQTAFGYKPFLFVPYELIGNR